MRKRKRDWPIIVCRYRLIAAEVADEVWATAEKQRQLWNQLVEWFEMLRLLDQMYGVAKFWAAFNVRAKELVEAATLDWVNGPDVLDRFRASLKRSGRVRYQRRSETLSIAHRFTNGGLSVAQLLANRGARLRLVIPSNWSYNNARSQRPHGHRPLAEHPLLIWSMAGSTSRFRAILHRQLPPEAIVKRAMLTAEAINHERWLWYLCFVLEVPPRSHQSKTRNSSGGSSQGPTSVRLELNQDGPRRGEGQHCNQDLTGVAGLDLGWRVFKGYLRVGMIADSEGHLIELRLPWGINPNRQSPSHKHASWVTTESEVRSLRDQRRNAGKADEVARLTAELRLLGLHWRQRRRWYYYNLAHWLCARYSRIIWEGKLDLVKMARRVPDNIPLAQAAKYRAMAATGELRGIITSVAAKHGTELIGGEMAYSTTTCIVCGEQAQPGPSLMLECANGHCWDQDICAAYNLLSQTYGGLQQIEVLRKIRSANSLKALEISASIAAVTIEVPPA